MLKFLSSVKLTLILLLLLAVLSVGGTISPPEAQRYELFYQSPWFRVLLGLLALNLICCTLKSLPKKLRYRQQLQEMLRSRNGDGERLAVAAPESLAKRLSASGYRVTADQDRLIAERSWGRWGSTLIHVSILLIMLGGVLGETGFVGTINTYLKYSNSHYFDWDVEQERELGFQVRADAFRLRYYPIQLRFELFEVSSGVSHGILMMYDNELFTVPGTNLAGQLRGFDPDARILTIDVLAQDTLLGQYRIGDSFESFGEQHYPGFRLRNLEFRDPVVKQIEADVSILDGGQVVKSGTIRVNEPLHYQGISIYQTAYGKDEFGNQTVGFQLSRDPGENLVWAATLLLMFGFALVLFAPRRAVGVKQVAGEWQLFPLVGWPGESGRERFVQLLERLAGDESTGDR